MKQPKITPSRNISRRQMMGRTLVLGAGIGAGSGALLSLSGCGGGGDPGTTMNAQGAAARLPDLAAQLLQTSKVPGLAWAVVQGDQLIAAQGLGVCEAGTQQAVNADTTFQLASLSKSVGSAVVAHQVSQGRVAWDTRIQSLLPFFELRNAASSQQLTIADLYSHRSGLPEHAGDTLEVVGYSQREVLERLRFVPVHTLRSDYAYTNMGLTAAAVAVAHASGVEWATLSRESLYAPLGMTRTTSVYAEFMQQSNRAISHIKADDGSWMPTPLRNADVQAPAGGVSTSVRDMARWMSLMLGKGQIEGRRLIAESAMAPIFQPQAPGGAYGLGVVLGKTPGGRPTVTHSGAFITGASTCFLLVPSLNIGIVALCNVMAVGVPEALCNQFVDLVEGGSVSRDWLGLYGAALAGLAEPSGSLAGQKRPEIPESAGPLARYVGLYDNPYYGVAEVRLVDGALHLGLGPERAVAYVLAPWSGQNFTFDPGNFAPSHSVSQANFGFGGVDPSGPASSLWLEVFDDEGFGMFTRTV